MRTIRSCMLAAALGAAAALSPTLVAQQGWQPVGGQPANGSAMAYDSVRQVTMLFDGWLGCTHEWDGNAWSLVSNAGPVTGGLARLAFDRLRGRAVLWLDQRGETWEWNGTQWVRIQTNTPSPRYGSEFVFDEATQRVMAHGGSTAPFAGTPLTETWLFDGTTWTLATSAGPALKDAAIASDPVRARTLMVCGSVVLTTFPFGAASNAMWEWNGVTWTQLPTVAPAAGIGKGAFDPFRQCFVLVVTPGGFSLPQTWEWKGATWSPGNSTIPTHGHSPIDLAFDVARNVTLAFGNNVTAVWNGTTWFAADQSPVGGQEQWMVADTVRQRLVLLRGGQTWEWDGRWRVAAVGAPANKTGLALAFDRGRARTVSFGGTSTPTTTAIRNETWEWDGLTWTRATPPVSPPGRDGAGLVADEARHQVLLFGGTGSGPLADTWTWDGVTWTQRIGAVNPSARLNPGMAYDEHRQRVVMFGGRGPAILPDTWEWDGTTWALAASTGPSLRELPGMAYDPRRSRVVLYGGLSSHLLDTWEWDGSAWLPTPVAPGLVIFPVIDFDPRRGRMLAFGELVDVTTFQSVGTAVFELADDAVGVPCHPLAAGGAGLAIDDRAPRLGSTVHATVTTPLASSAAIVLLGTEVLAPALDLSPIGLPGCRLQVQPDELFIIPAAGGQASWTAQVPNWPALLGIRFALQALVHAPGLALGATATNASVLVVTP